MSKKKMAVIIGTTVLGALILISTALFLMGGTQMKNRKPLYTEMNKSESEEVLKQRQIAFLKKHEQEMTSFIREHSVPNVKVSYDWKSVKQVTSMMFSEPTLEITFVTQAEVKDLDDSNMNMLHIHTNAYKLDKMGKMGLSTVYSEEKGGEVSD